MGRGREKAFGRNPAPAQSGADSWQAPSKEEKEAARQAARTETERAKLTQPQTIETELFAATMNQSLPHVDFHGHYTEDVESGINDLLATYPGECVRIIFGNGRGAIERTVMQYLARLKGGKNPRIVDFQRDARTASVVVKVR